MSKSWLAGFLLMTALAVGCSASEPLDLAEFPPDGALDCTDDSDWAIQGSPNLDVAGAENAEEAITDALRPYVERDDSLQGPQNVRDGVASLLDSQNREVVVVTVSEISPDNWFAGSFTGCPGHEPA